MEFVIWHESKYLETIMGVPVAGDLGASNSWSITFILCLNLPTRNQRGRGRYILWDNREWPYARRCYQDDKKEISMLVMQDVRERYVMLDAWVLVIPVNKRL